LLGQADTVRHAVDAIQLTDNPNGQIHVSGLAAAGMLVQEGIDPVLHMTCRDRNRIALQSDLLGAAALGVTSLLFMRGDDLHAKQASAGKPVFDLGARDLIASARAIKDGRTPAGYALAQAPDLFVGTIATVFKPVSRWKPGGLKTKIDAGAQFIQTQLCFDMEVLRRYMARLVSAKLIERVHVLVGVGPLPSADSARWRAENLRGALMPGTVIRRLEQASDPEQEGVKICAELLQELAEIPGVSGANLMTPGDLGTIPAAIQAAGVRK
jgi:methylenetetrahydrofolate reductase (NADPH)